VKTCKKYKNIQVKMKRVGTTGRSYGRAEAVVEKGRVRQRR